MKTYGKIVWQSNTWIIEAAPHVLIKLRRMFPRVSRRDGFVGMADTTETSRDLEWFLSRYPLEYVGDAESRLSERARKHRDGEALVDKLLKGVMPAMNFKLALPAREYQKLGGTLFLNTDGILIADEMGTGKTVTAICGLTDGRARPALVVTLTSLPKQWESELRKFAPRLTTHILQGTRPYDITKRCDGKFPEVVITSYSKLDGWWETLSVSGLFKSVVFDEVQELRNGDKTDKGKAAYAIRKKVKYCAGLSGSPVFNMGGEIRPVLEAVRPGALGSHSEFQKEWTTGDAENPGKLKIKDPKALGAYLIDSGLMIRRTTKDIGRELPERTRVPHQIDTDATEFKKVESKALELSRIILAKSQQARGASMQASGELDNLVRQATGVAKAAFVAEFVRILAESDERVVVFAWHREVYRILLENFSDKKLGDLRPVLYTGTESPKQKEESKERFCGGDARVMLMSLRSGVGLDGIQHHCRIGVFAELDWSPAVHDQCEMRIARDGQMNKTLFYYLLSTSGSDPIVSDVLGVKQGQLEGIRDHKGALEHVIDSDGKHVRKLAEAYILKHTKSLPSGARVVK